MQTIDIKFLIVKSCYMVVTITFIVVTAMIPQFQMFSQLLGVPPRCSKEHHWCNPQNLMFSDWKIRVVYGGLLHAVLWFVANTSKRPWGL